MFHIVLALGLVIGGILYSIVIQATPKTGMQPHEYYALRQYASIGYILGLMLAYALARAISLKSRVPTKLPAYPLLIIGVWFSVIKIIYETFIEVKIASGYFLGSLPFHDTFGVIIQSLYLNYIPFGTLASALILYALLIIFLESSPRTSIVND